MYILPRTCMGGKDMSGTSPLSACNILREGVNGRRGVGRFSRGIWRRIRWGTMDMES